MAGELTARDIVNEVRWHLKEVNLEPFRDGFTTDPSTSPTLIPIFLAYVNPAYRFMLMAGEYSELFAAPLASGQRNFTLDNRANKYSKVFYQSALGSQTLVDITGAIFPEEYIERRVPGYLSAPTGNPYLCWHDSQMVFVHPRPSVSGVVYYRAQAALPYMSGPTSIPSGIPVQHHSTLSLLSAYLMAMADAEDEAQQARANALLGMVASQNPALAELVRARGIIEAVPRKGPE